MRACLSNPLYRAAALEAAARSPEIAQAPGARETRKTSHIPSHTQSTRATVTRYRRASHELHAEPSKQPVAGSNPAGGVGIRACLFSPEALLLQAFKLRGLGQLLLILDRLRATPSPSPAVPGWVVPLLGGVRWSWGLGRWRADPLISTNSPSKRLQPPSVFIAITCEEQVGCGEPRASIPSCLSVPERRSERH